ncbi:uncharacterized protein [Musca autumnalis]|uniref:uncharacterized protein n=1 Tax=Musca autumnalis TaxID=221902 RepID=UPI003CEAC75F
MASVPHTDGQDVNVEMLDGVVKKLQCRKEVLRDKLKKMRTAKNVDGGGDINTNLSDGVGTKRPVKENGDRKNADNAASRGAEANADVKKRRFNDEVVLYTTDYRANCKNDRITWTGVLSLLDECFDCLCHSHC